MLNLPYCHADPFPEEPTGIEGTDVKGKAYGRALTSNSQITVSPRFDPSVLGCLKRGRHSLQVVPTRAEGIPA